MATILTIIPYSFYPPVNGGALRCFYLLREMSRYHTIYVLTTQKSEDFKLHAEPEFPENIQVVSTHGVKKYRSIFNVLPARVADALNFRYIVRSVSATANETLLSSYSTLQKLLHEQRFDIIFYESLNALGLFRDIIRRNVPAVFHLYDAHNVDSLLWLQQAEAQKSKKLESYAKGALSLEKMLYKKVDAFFCCSEEDLIKLTSLNGNRIQGIVIPNGVDIAKNSFDERSDKHLSKQLIFCGSLDYLPNREGLLWFYINVFPLVKSKVPGVSLTVIGSNSQPDAYEQLMEDTAVNFVGRVEHVVSFYHQSSISIAPLLSGSGTRLKILEAMSLGNPVVSTTVGAEGILYKEGEHLLIADIPEQFAEHIANLLSNSIKFNTIRTQAYKLVKTTYNWKKIGKYANYNISKLTSL
ncbi:glycosyltransferase family 4 protein [Pontibacter locisalis]|uniref:Glycosyltransferase family 4 protein n=1 Tax=Pontibacter locisalis TaxID=1719035 RepID=A0ABW5ISC8_9BACT